MSGILKEGEKGVGLLRRKLYGNAIEPICELCEVGTRSADGSVILCPRQGVVPLYHHCRRFVYTPLKRVPVKPPRPAKHDPEDFTL